MKFLLQEVRESRELSQMQLAVACELSLSTIQKYERGNKQQYSHEILQKFCEVLECEPGDLFSLEPVAA
ncbi:MAG: helix-turn-helix transcriptional regulator [Richelia sp. SL_2_1]|nr:helix-turn-helix transcriptional regulator [Richelia sp. SL_2_1]